MATVYIARSPKLCDWASDVGLSKHIFKVGVTEEPLDDVLTRGWAGESDWSLVKKQEDVDVLEGEAISRLAGREKLIDPRYYPRLREASGIFKVSPENVQRHILLGRALAGENERAPLRIKATDYAQYLIRHALGSIV